VGKIIGWGGMERRVRRGGLKGTVTSPLPLYRGRGKRKGVGRDLM